MPTLAPANGETGVAVEPINPFVIDCIPPEAGPANPPSTTRTIRYAEKEDPQPQVDAALGLRMTN